MKELLQQPMLLPHPREVQGVFGKLDAATIEKFKIEQTPGFETHFIPYKRGRLALEVAGPADGRVMIIFHGMPGCRISDKPSAEFAVEKGIRLIAFDRPGWGFSDPETICGSFDTPSYMEAIFDYFQFNHNSQTVDLIGRSGGAEYAWAGAALWPDVVGSVVGLGSMAPRFDFDQDWYDGMGESNRNIFSSLFEVPEFESEPGTMASAFERRAQMMEHIIDLTTKIQQRKTALFDDEHGEDRPKDKEEHYKISSGHAHQAGLRQGPEAWLKAIFGQQSWGFHVEAIGRYVGKNGRKINSMVWSAKDDRFTPAKHSQHLARLMNATKEVEATNATHFTAIGAMEYVMEWCLENASQRE